ncbi:uncharacterized protein GLRG_06137, partial [Colletotrichum graminicola M1.001]
MLLANRAWPNRRFVPCMPGKLGMQRRVAPLPSAGEEMKEEKNENENENRASKQATGCLPEKKGKEKRAIIIIIIIINKNKEKNK